MSSVIVDQIYIKTIQRIIKRKLNNKEMEAIRCEEPIFVQNPSGLWFSFRVPILKFPHDLMPKSVDLYQIEQTSEHANIWEYLFGTEPSDV